MSTLFEKIANKEIPSYIVWEDDIHMAFLDIMPLTPGQILVIPKANLSDNLFHLTDQEFSQLMLAAKKVAQIMEDKLNIDRVFLVVEGLEVPHVHIKLIPSNQGEISSLSRYTATEDELKQIHSTLLSSRI